MKVRICLTQGKTGKTTRTRQKQQGLGKSNKDWFQGLVSRAGFKDRFNVGPYLLPSGALRKNRKDWQNSKKRKTDRRRQKL
jgi:hypothetical protein